MLSPSIPDLSARSIAARRALVQSRYGKPEDVLELRDDVAKPQVGEKQVLVRVVAT